MKLKKDKKNWIFLTLLLMTFLAPLSVAADTFVDRSYNYMVSLSGANKIKIQMALYDQDGTDAWVEIGKLNFSVVGGDGTTYELVQWQAQTNIASSADENHTYLKVLDQGWYYVEPGENEPFTLDNEHGWDTYCWVKRPSWKTDFSFSVTWTIPANLRGKQLKFSWDVIRDGNVRDRIPVNIDGTTIAVRTAPSSMTPL